MEQTIAGEKSHNEFQHSDISRAGHVHSGKGRHGNRTCEDRSAATRELSVSEQRTGRVCGAWKLQINLISAKDGPLSGTRSQTALEV